MWYVLGGDGLSMPATAPRLGAATSATALGSDLHHPRGARGGGLRHELSPPYAKGLALTADSAVPAAE